MLHLDTDRLAALADETPTDAEASHLAACVVCRRERDAFVALLALAQREGSAALETEAAHSSGPPLTSWDTISSSLRAEGLIRPSASSHALMSTRATTVRPIGSARSATFLRRAAASIALILGGGAIGRITAPQVVAANGPRAQALQEVAIASPTTLPAPTPTPRADSVAPTNASRGLSDTLPVWGEADAQLASARGFSGIPDALQTLARAQREYQRAAAYLSEHDTTTAVGGTPQVLRARLAALDEVMPKVREALYEAPQDPVLNQYYLTTADVRESTLRQLGRALPTVGRQLNGY